MPSEQDIQRRILKELKRRDIYAVKVINANRNGVPDILACWQGQFLAIEVKSDTGRVSPVQQHHLEQIRERGGTALVARCWEDVATYLGDLGGSTCSNVPH